MFRNQLVTVFALTMIVSNLGLSEARRVNAQDTLVVEPSWWHAEKYNYEIGYEAAATNTTGVLGQNVVVFGTWFTHELGADFFLGYTKSQNAHTTSVSDVTNTVASPNTKVTTTSNAGANTEKTFALAGNVKYRLYQTDWFQLNVGLMAGVVLPGSAEYATGTKAETYADVSVPGNKTVVETSLGTIKTSTKMALGVGPRIATQFYVKWFPHLSLGLSTGIFTFFGGDTETITDTVTRSYTVTNGTEGTPTAASTTHTVATTPKGMRGTTFGLGGTEFSLVGNFTIRYVF